MKGWGAPDRPQEPRGTVFLRRLPSQAAAVEAAANQRSTVTTATLGRFLLQDFILEGHHFEAASVLLGLRILPGVLLELPFDLDAIAGADCLGERLAGFPVHDDGDAGGLLLPLLAAVVLVRDVQRGARDRAGLRDPQLGLDPHAAFELHVVPVVPGFGASGCGCWIAHKKPSYK